MLTDMPRGPNSVRQCNGCISLSATQLENSRAGGYTKELDDLKTVGHLGGWARRAFRWIKALL